MTVKAILEQKGHDVFTFGPNEKLADAIRILTEHRIGALVITNGDRKIVGILSERDIVRAASRDEATVFGLTVGSLMSRDVIVGVPQDDLASAGSTMTERRIRHLPVVEKGRLVGIISIGDVVKAQRDQYQGEVDTLQTQLIEEQAEKRAS